MRTAILLVLGLLATPAPTAPRAPTPLLRPGVRVVAAPAAGPRAVTPTGTSALDPTPAADSSSPP